MGARSTFQTIAQGSGVSIIPLLTSRSPPEESCASPGHIPGDSRREPGCEVGGEIVVRFGSAMTLRESPEMERLRITLKQATGSSSISMAVQLNLFR